MNEEEFYNAVADIFGMTYEFRERPKKRTRWGPRHPGNGRFPKHGIIRWFGPNTIHVSLTNPRLSGIYTEPETVLTALRELMPGNTNAV